MIPNFSNPQKFFCKTAILAAVLLLQPGFPPGLFPQAPPDSWNRGSLNQSSMDASRRILDYQFDRADRELNPDRWMEEARRGIMVAMSLWAEMTPEIFLDPGASSEIIEWTEEVLENRFTKWLLERFFGAGIEVPASKVFRETGEADKFFIYLTGPDGNILYDPRTGDPKIIRPGDEGHEFAEDLLSWRQITHDAADREVLDYGIALKEFYPELLEYISPDREGEFERKLAAAGDRAVLSLRHEFEAILAREERYFTAQRLGDVWSLRKKSEDTSAEAIGAKLIEEAGQICADGIASIEARIEAAKTEGGDFVLAGEQWLVEYREQFERGLKAWESAEERFLVRRIEWEQSAENTFYEGRDAWNAVFVRFEEERLNWEEKARNLFLEGEQFFIQASETLAAAIAEARLEFERDSRIRMEAASGRAEALTSMYVLSASAAKEAEKNMDFWMGRFRELTPGIVIPAGDAEFEEWINLEILRYGGPDGSLEGLILEELKIWSMLYQDYAARTEEYREQLAGEFFSIAGLWDNFETGNIFSPGSYEIELIRAEGEYEYWKNRTALSEAVAAYAEALDAGRITAAESAEAWENARAAYNEAAALYGEAESSLKAAGAEVSAARDALLDTAESMKAADLALDKLRRNYQNIQTIIGNRGSAVLADDLAFLNLALKSEQEILGGTGEISLWGKFLSCAREIETIQLDECRKMISRQLITGDGGSLESLAGLAEKVLAPDFTIDETFLDFTEVMRKGGKITEGQYNLLLSSINDFYRSLAENELTLRLASLSLIIENSSTAEWYLFAHNAGGMEIKPQMFSDVREQLLYDCEWDKLELIRARAELELEALDFLSGKETGEAAAILASLYSGDETKIAQDREALEQLLYLLGLLMEDSAETFVPGYLYKSLLDASAGNERMSSFISGYSLIDPKYGREFSDAFLIECIMREEFSRGLLNLYLDYEEISPVIARENFERGLTQLRRLWGNLGIETGDSIIPGAETIFYAIQDYDGDAVSGVFPFLLIMDEIFTPFPSWFGLSYGIWKESFVNYCISPSEDTLSEVKRNTDLANAALSFLVNMDLMPAGKEFEYEAELYLADPLKNWDEGKFIPDDGVDFGNYEAALGELLDHYSMERIIKGEIERLSALADLSNQDTAAKEKELNDALAAITLEEENYQELSAAYTEAARNFILAGEAYDAKYNEAGKAFRDLEDSRMAFDTQDAIRLWAESAYLDSRKPAEELRYNMERRDHALEALELIQSLYPEINEARTGEYEDALMRYRESLNLYTLSLDLLYHHEWALDAEMKTNESVYWAYQNQLSLFGSGYSPDDGYISPEDRKLWDIKDMITLKDGVLAFSWDDEYGLAGSDEERSELLKDYFSKNILLENEANPVSLFELALRDLAEDLSGLSQNSYFNLGLARDYLVNQLLNNNPKPAKADDWYRKAEAMREGNNLGSMVIGSDGKEKVSERIGSFEAKVFNMQKTAWESLDENMRKVLEFYTILTLLGGGGSNADSFSRISEFNEYRLAFSYAMSSYNKASGLVMIPFAGIFFISNSKKAMATSKALMVPLNELEKVTKQGYYGLNETLESLDRKLNSYKESSERLSILNNGKGGPVSWENIVMALGPAGNFGDLASLEELWNQINANQSGQINNVGEALKLLSQASMELKQNNYSFLNQLWNSNEEEKASYELVYRKIYNAYLAGQADPEDLKTIAVLSFGGVSLKEHLGNTGIALMESLDRFMERGLGGTAEYAELAEEFAGCITKAWEEKYAAELEIRENEWELQQRDIAEKLGIWQKSAAAIFEQGRMSWKDGEEKLREASVLWAKTFEEEYVRIKDGWTAAYLEGLGDKEVWAAMALEAANEASSAAIIAMIGTSAEAGARAMDTRDPLGFMNLPDMREGERILAELLEKSGVESLTKAFGSIQGSRETFATTVRTGLGGSGVWNSGAVMSEASNLARSTREEFETRESRKMAYMVLDSAKEAYRMLEERVLYANDDFRKKIDEMFVMDGQWRRSGSKYIKDVIVYSTLFSSIITDFAEVEGYLNYLIPQTRLASYLYSDLPQNMDPVQADSFMDSIYSEVIELYNRIFGTEEEVEKGEFIIHLGNQPKTKDKPNVDKGRSGIFSDQGDGEIGRLLTEFQFWMAKENLGIQMVAMAPWDKPMWDSRGSSIKAPSLRSAVSVVLQTGVMIAGIAGAPFTGGSSILGTIAIGAAINSVDDLVFAALDVSFGYKSWGEVGVEFGKQLLMNTVNSAASVFFGGIKGFGEGTFLGSGGFSGLVTAKGIGGVAFKTFSTGLQSFTTGTINSLIASVTYSDNEGFGFSKKSFSSGVINAGIGSLSAMTGTFTSGILDMGLTGFVGDLFKNGQKLNTLAGGLASQGVNLAFGNDFTLNILNIGRLFNEDASIGLLELHLGKGGISLEFGNSGADVSIGALWNAVKGFDTWRVNAKLLTSKEDAAHRYKSQMRTLYSLNDVTREEYESVLAGKTRYVESNVLYTESIFDEETGIKTVHLGLDALNDGSLFGLNVLFSHEAYRDGTVGTVEEQIAETKRAVTGHSEAALAIIGTYGIGSLEDWMTSEALTYAEAINTDNMDSLQTLFGSYDFSADYWKLMRDGTLVNDNSGWLTNEDGTYVKDAQGRRIGADGIETGLLNILFGGTSNQAYSTYTIEQIQQVQFFMMMAGMKYKNGSDASILSRTWNGNEIGLTLNMNTVMYYAGNTIASQVFARYYDSTVDSAIADFFGKDIGDVTKNTVPATILDRYSDLAIAKLKFYIKAGSFVDLSKDYYISLEFGKKYNDNYVFYNFLHYGFDLGREGGSLGDDLYAGISGVVSSTNWNYSDNGNSLQIEYGYFFEDIFIGSGIYGEYLHMKDKPSFATGKYLDADVKIGQIAGTPKYDPHLHYDILTKKGNYTQTVLSMLLGKDAASTSFKSTNDVNTVYNPALYYNNFLGKNLYTESEYYAAKNK